MAKPTINRVSGSEDLPTYGRARSKAQRTSMKAEVAELDKALRTVSRAGGGSGKQMFGEPSGPVNSFYNDKS